VGGEDEQAVLADIGEGNHLEAGGGVVGFPRVKQACCVAVVAVGDDADVFAYRLDCCVDIVFVCDCEEAVSDVLLIEAVDKRFLGGGGFNDFVCGFFPVLIQHRDQAEVCCGRSFEVEPVDYLAAEGVLVRPDGAGGCELFEPGKGDEAEALNSSLVARCSSLVAARLSSPKSGQIEILGVGINGIGPILFQGTFLEPVIEIFCGPCVGVIAGVVGGGCFAFGYANDVVFAFFMEMVLLGGADDIVGRRDAPADVADYGLVESECSERLNFHNVCQKGKIAGSALSRFFWFPAVPDFFKTSEITRRGDNTERK